MSTIHDIQIGQRFSFEVYATAILGNGFKDVVLEAIFGSRQALQLGEDIVSLHRNVYTSLPPGVPNDPTQYSYIRVQMPSGDLQTIGIPWIRPDSIILASSAKLTLSFLDTSPIDRDRIMQALSAINKPPSTVIYE